MKKCIIIAIVCTFLSTFSFSQGNLASQETPQKRFNSMIGLWQIVNNQDTGGSLEIIDSTSIFIKFMGDEKRLISYKIDFSHSPYWFDFSVRDTASIQNFKSIIDFVNDDMLKWQIFDGERSDHFTSSSGELFYLKRTRKTNTFFTAN